MQEEEKLVPLCSRYGKHYGDFSKNLKENYHRYRNSGCGYVYA